MAECDLQIEAALCELTADREPLQEALGKARQRNKASYALKFDVRGILCRLAGVDLTEIHGIGPYLALRMVTKCGTDMSR